MKQIFDILKKQLYKIILVVVLLVLMAECDLALPEYTSSIVNVGIQQNGIEEKIPVVITDKTYNILYNNLDDLSVLDNYKMISKDSLKETDYNNYLKKYPLLEKETIYVLNTSNVDSIKDSITNALLSFSFNLMGQKNLDPNTLDDSIKEEYMIKIISEEYELIGIDLESNQMNYIINMGIKMLLFTLLSALLIIINSYMSSKISASFARDLRYKVVNKVMQFSNEEFDKMSASSLITRSTNDVQQVQNLLTMFLRIIIYAPIIGIGALLKVLKFNMSWVIAVAVGCILLIVILLLVLAIPNFRKVQELLDKVNLISREILTGIPVIRAFSNEKYEEKKFDKANRNLTKVNTFVNRVMSIMMPTMNFIMCAICILIIWIGADEVNKSNMQVGDLMAFISYTSQILIAFLMISLMSIMLPRAIVALKRIAEVLNKKISIIEIENPKSFDDSIKGKIEFKNVSFRYPDADEDVLSNISFVANKGETVAFIGSTGSGKSTLINLIPRFFDVTEGSILVDNIDIRDVSLHDLRDKMGYVPQKGMLFLGNIKSNLKLSNEDYSDDEIKKACEVSQANDFILSNDLKYNLEISQNGNNVSGGQKQRLSIARAIIKKPEFYIFDDSFSALDFKTDSNLRKSLKKYTKDATTLIVGQRISSIMNSDKIIVLENGKIVGIGKHKELLKKCDVYKEIALSQLKEEEL